MEPASHSLPDMVRNVVPDAPAPELVMVKLVTPLGILGQ